MLILFKWPYSNIIHSYSGIYFCRVLQQNYIYMGSNIRPRSHSTLTHTEYIDHESHSNLYFSFNATDIKRRSYLFICQPWPSIIPHCDLRLVRVAHIIKSHIRNTRSVKKQNETINVEKYLQDKAYQITHLRCFTTPIF